MVPGPDASEGPHGAQAVATGPVAPPDSWASSGHVASPPYSPHLEAVRQARTFVREQLELAGLDACADDAGLMVSELAANAVLHARTPFSIHLRPTLEGGARVEVHDQSPLPPVFTAPSATAMSGRGLNLVQTMAVRWGSHPLTATVADGANGANRADGEEEPEATGKMVWFEVEPTGTPAPPETSIEELLALWNDAEDAADPLHTGSTTGVSGPVTGSVATARRGGIITSSLPALGTTREVVVADLPVAELLAAKEAMDDLLRELQLLLLATPPAGTALDPVTGGPPAGATPTDRWLDLELVVAARLDAAARGFEQGRRQIREQVTRAAASGLTVVTVHLSLPEGAGEVVARYREVVEDAERLSRSGHLLAITDDLDRHTQVRRHYLDEIIRQLAEPR